MRIAFYTDTYLPNRDGVVTSILNFRKELERRGHEVFIFASGTKKQKMENKDPKVFFYRGIPFKPYPQYKIALFPFLSSRTVRKLDIDIVHSHGIATMGWAAQRAARSLKVPYIATLHTLIPLATHYLVKGERTKRVVTTIAWKYLKIYFNNCDAPTAPSRTIKEVMEAHGIKETYVLPNGIDFKKFSRSSDGKEVRRWWGLEDKRVILHLGRLVLEKNLDVLIRAALFILEEEPDTRFLIVGKGPAAHHYMKMTKEMGVDRYFIFTGFVEDRYVPQYYAAADVVIIPSKFETQGLVTLEAMAAGRKVVGANYLATKEIISDGVNGFLFNPDDPEDCAEKVIKALKADKGMTEAARKKASEYSVERCTDRLIRFYEEMMARE